MYTKKLASAALALTLCLGLAACGGGQENSSGGGTPQLDVDHPISFSQYLSGDGTKILYNATDIGKDDRPNSIMVVEGDKLSYIFASTLTFGEYAQMTDEEVVAWVKTAELDPMNNYTYRVTDVPYMLYITTDSTGNQTESEHIVFPHGISYDYLTIEPGLDRFGTVYDSFYIGLSGLLLRMDPPEIPEGGGAPDYSSPYTVDTVGTEGVGVDLDEQDLDEWVAPYRTYTLEDGTTVPAPQDGSTTSVVPLDGGDSIQLSADSLTLLEIRADPQTQIRMGTTFQELTAAGFTFNVDPSTVVDGHQTVTAEMSGGYEQTRYGIEQCGVTSVASFTFYNNSSTPRPVSELPIGSFDAYCTSLLQLETAAGKPFDSELLEQTYSPFCAYVNWAAGESDLWANAGYIWKGTDCYYVTVPDNHYGYHTYRVVRDIPEMIEADPILKQATQALS